MTLIYKETVGKQYQKHFFVLYMLYFCNESDCKVSKDWIYCEKYKHYNIHLLPLRLSFFNRNENMILFKYYNLFAPDACCTDSVVDV